MKSMKTNMKISVVVPVYNEHNTIREILHKVKSVLGSEDEVVIVDDGSNDGTREILRELEKDFRIFYHDKNLGKGAGIRTALEKAVGDVIIIQDADLEYDPGEYQKLLKPISEGKADVVFGSRFQGSEAKRVLFYWHYVGNKFLTRLSNMLTNLNLSDMETCYKVFTRQVAQTLKIKENRFGFEPEFTAKVAKGGWKIYEVGVSYAGRDYSEGKKIGWIDGIRALWCILRYNIFR